MRIGGTGRARSLLQSIAVLGQLLKRKKLQPSRFQELTKHCTSVSECSRRHASIGSVFLARKTRVLMRVLIVSVVKQAEGTKYPWLIANDTNMSPEYVEKSLGSEDDT